MGDRDTSEVRGRRPANGVHEVDGTTAAATGRCHVEAASTTEDRSVTCIARFNEKRADAANTMAAAARSNRWLAVVSRPMSFRSRHECRGELLASA